MEKTFREIASEFLTELAIERGQKKTHGINGFTTQVFKCECPLLNDNGEEDKVIINNICVSTCVGGKPQLSICTHDYYAKHVSKCEDDYLRLVVRSITTAYGLQTIWLRKLGGVA